MTSDQQRIAQLEYQLYRLKRVLLLIPFFGLVMQKITASRQKRMARVYYTGLVIAAAIMAYLVYRT